VKLPQAQRPSTQMPCKHRMLQAPQWLALEFVSTQAPLQTVPG
jgi:hypothetical protein